jgi:hypothetical protein
MNLMRWGDVQRMPYIGLDSGIEGSHAAHSGTKKGVPGTPF